MKKFKKGDLVKGIGCNSDILKAVVTREPWEEDEIEWVELKIIDSTSPVTIGITFSVCTSYVEKISAEDNSSGESKFVVGDHVKGNEKSNTPEYDITNQNLIDAEVIEADEIENEIRIKCIRFLDGSTEDIGFITWVDADRFDYADGYSPDSGFVSSYMINGQEYTNEQFIRDCKRFVMEFPNGMNIELPQSMNTILTVYKWAKQNPMVTNLDHYAIEFDWTPEQKAEIKGNAIAFPYTCNDMKIEEKVKLSQKWWDEEYQPKGAKCSTQ